MKKSLLTTNPYLKDEAVRERFLTRNIESSSAVEGIQVKRDSSGRFIANSSSVPEKAVKRPSR
jgi:hypothetical protein